MIYRQHKLPFWLTAKQKQAYKFAKQRDELFWIIRKIAVLKEIGKEGLEPCEKEELHALQEDVDYLVQLGHRVPIQRRHTWTEELETC